jgi:DNA mismatch endonuclease (patch repair protein)
VADVFSREKRSEVMSRIRGRGNRATELAFAKLLRAEKITGWRRHLPLPGRPDFAFRRFKVAVFVDGCFWHCCPRCSNRPANNREFWAKKLDLNVERDRRVNEALANLGWNVVRIWEHELKHPAAVVDRVAHTLAEAGR